MDDDKLYVNLKKCVFCVAKVSVIECYISKTAFVRTQTRSP